MGDDCPTCRCSRAAASRSRCRTRPTAVQRSAHYVTRAGGGRGAVRELCELLLRAQGPLDRRQARRSAPERAEHDTLERRIARSPLVAWSPLLLLGALAALTYWLDAQVQARRRRARRLERHDPDIFVEGFRAIELDANGQLRHTLAAQGRTHFPDDDIDAASSAQLVVHRARQAHASPSTANRGSHHRRPARTSTSTGDVKAVAASADDAGRHRRARSRSTSEYLHVIPKQDKIADRQAGDDRASRVDNPRPAAWIFDNKTKTSLQARAAASVRHLSNPAPTAPSERRSPLLRWRQPRSRCRRRLRAARRPRPPRTPRKPTARSRSTSRRRRVEVDYETQIGNSHRQRRDHAGHDDHPRRPRSSSSRTPTTRCRHRVRQPAVLPPEARRRRRVHRRLRPARRVRRREGAARAVRPRAAEAAARTRSAATTSPTTPSTEFFQAEGRPDAKPGAGERPARGPRARRVPAEAEGRSGPERQGRDRPARSPPRPANGRQGRRAAAAQARRRAQAGTRDVTPRRADRARLSVAAPEEALQVAHRRERRVARSAQRRSDRPARPERRRQDHVLLHDRRARRRWTAASSSSTASDLTHMPIHARARLRPVLPAAGSVDLPQAHGRGEHPRGARAAGHRRRRRSPTGSTRCSRTAHRAPARQSRRSACPAASGAGSRSRARWRPSRASSCSTSRSPASTRSRCSRSRRSSASSRSAASAC